MLRRDPTYKRVRAGGRDITGKATYWLAEDYLLVVREEGFHERYRRFFHRDVQALVISRTSWGTIVSVVLALFGALFIFASIGSESGTAKWVLAVFAGIFVTGLLANFFAGPTCQCLLRTAVQAELLPAVNRVKRAHRLLGEMSPLVARAQSDLPQNPVPPPPLPQADPIASAPTPMPIAVEAPRVVRHYHGLLHEIALGFVLVDAALGFFLLASRIPSISHINFGVNFIEWGFLVAALVRGRATDIPRLVRNSAWTVLTYYAIKLLVSVPIAVVDMMSGAQRSPDMMLPWNNPRVFGFLLCSNLFLLVVGLVGLRSLRRFRKAYQHAAPPPLPALAVSPAPPTEDLPPPQAPPPPAT